MGYIIRDWRCPQCGAVEENMTLSAVGTLPCRVCSSDMVVKPAMPHIANMRMGVDTVGCPTAAAKWAKAHKSKAPE